MKRKTRGYWQDVSNIKSELCTYVKKFGAPRLTYTELRKRGYNNLINGMKRFGINLTEFCKELDIPINYTPKNFYTNITNVVKELKQLVKIYGCIPSKEQFELEGKFQLYQSIYKFHGGIDFVSNLVGAPRKSGISKLEHSVKTIIDEYVISKNYVDNGRKNLMGYGLSTKTKSTKQWLEVDRYYYELKVAIEIHGQQHFKSSHVWDSERVNSVKKNDRLKKRLLKEQGVTLIVIPYNKASKRYIRKQLIKCGVLKLREFGETPKGTIPSQAKSNSSKV